MRLETRRMLAAEASRGISSGPSYLLARQLLAASLPLGKTLEFGAGAGNFAKQLLAEQLASSVTCADILPRPGDLLPNAEWIQADLNNTLDAPEGSFDTVVCIEVIEHLENPRAVFREFHRLLRPGGALVVTTPNQESIRSLASLLIGHHFAAFLGASYPAHITALLEKDLQRICAETGFQKPRFAYTNTGRLPKIPTHRWPSAFRGRLFSDNVGLYTRSVSQ